MNVLAVFVIAFITSSCRGDVNRSPGLTPAASITPTLLFADLPQAAGTLAPGSTETPIAIVTSTPGPSPTPPVPQPDQLLTLIPTTPDNRWEACEGSPLSNLHAGDRAYISYEPYLPTRIRTQPGLYRSSVLGLIIPGEMVELLEGPACVDGAVWWKVKSLRKDLQGWVQEGDNEASWLVRTENVTGVIVPPPAGMLCPVNDETFCVFVNELESWVTRGDFEKILTNTRLYKCSTGDVSSGPAPPRTEGGEVNCAYWGVIGRGLGGIALTSTTDIEPSWAAYAAAPRKITALLLPPFSKVQPALPPSPALLIETADPLWDWLFFLDKSEESWQISVLVTLSRESDAYPLLLDDPIRWP